MTEGDWNVTQVLRVDEKTGDIFFEGVGHEKGWDPYYSATYRVNMDGKGANTGLRLLTPEPSKPRGNAERRRQVPRRCVQHTRRRRPSRLLRDAEGKRITEIATGDISRLKATGWQPPVGFTVKARDGKTDLYGMMFKPSNFDATKKYPIINYIYPGPQTGFGWVAQLHHIAQRRRHRAGRAWLHRCID